MEETSLQVGGKSCKEVSKGKHPKRRADGDALDGDVGLANELGGASRAEQAEAELVQRLGEGQQAGLVVDREEGWQRAAGG